MGWAGSPGEQPITPGRMGPLGVQGLGWPGSVDRFSFLSLQSSRVQKMGCLLRVQGGECIPTIRGQLLKSW